MRLSRRTNSCLRRAWPTGLDLAFGALEDEPMGPGVAFVAIPQDQGGVRLDHLEDVLAFSGSRH